jgi:3-hydroxyacyl-CoA dehydrogenase
MLDLGASPYAVDEAITGSGWGRAPFQSRDLTGLVAAAKLGKPAGGRNWSEFLASHDRKGWVAGRGFYDWGDAGATPSDAVLNLLEAKRAPKNWAAGDIHMLILAALANAGIKLVSSGMVRSAAEIDLVSILAQDFPAAQGGVMKAASQLGLFRLMKAMQRIEHPNREIWTPDPVWQDLVKNGQSFDAA